MNLFSGASHGMVLGGVIPAHLSWNPLNDIDQMLSYHFMVNTLRAGTIVAIVAAILGWFVVLRGQTFAAHTLAVVGFPGAAGATWLGLNVAFGYFGFCIAAAIGIGLSGAASRNEGLGRHSSESSVIATIQVVALGLGFLFVSLYNGLLDSIGSLLFGTIDGVSDNQVKVLLISGVLCIGAVALIGRRLLFASVDPDVAQANGVHLGSVGIAFLVLVGIAAAVTSQVTGTLLVFALLVAPAATAQLLTARPAAGIAFAVVIAVGETWLGESAAYFSNGPIGFWITSIAFGTYLMVRLLPFSGNRSTNSDLAVHAGGPR